MGDPSTCGTLAIGVIFVPHYEGLYSECTTSPSRGGEKVFPPPSHRACCQQLKTLHDIQQALTKYIEQQALAKILEYTVIQRALNNNNNNRRLVTLAEHTSDHNGPLLNSKYVDIQSAPTSPAGGPGGKGRFLHALSQRACCFPSGHDDSVWGWEMAVCGCEAVAEAAAHFKRVLNGDNDVDHAALRGVRNMPADTGSS